MPSTQHLSELDLKAQRTVDTEITLEALLQPFPTGYFYWLKREEMIDLEKCDRGKGETG